jgi:2-succinyl-6-hydroxy-2,4-cyclohexadiene-1-carboxylate synthase
VIYFERTGSGEASLLLHGFSGSGAEMLDLAGRLPGLKLLPDLPGHGRSAADRRPGSYGMATTLEELVGVLDAEGLESVDVVGYSMGGRVALAMAALHPDRVRTVTAIGARTGIADDSERAVRLAADEALAADIERNGAVWFADEWLSSPIYDTQRRLGEEHMARLREGRRAADPTGLAASLRESGPAAQPVVDELLAASGVRTLLLVGELDERFKRVAEAIASTNLAAEVRLVPDAGHAAHLEAPDATADEIVHFWSRLR